MQHLTTTAFARAAACEAGRARPGSRSPRLTMPATAPAPDQDGLAGRPRAQALLAILLSVALATLDTAIANTALPTIAASLRVDAAAVIWVVNAYQLAVVAVLLPLAASGEILGHGRVFAIGTLVFTAASLACGLAGSLATLVAARVLQGLGGAAIMSVNIALIRFVFPARLLGRGVGLNSLVVALAFTVGPTVASAILAVASWPWLFLVNVPVGAVAVVVAWKTLPATGRAGHGFDPVAAALCAALFATLVLGFETLAHDGAWTAVLAEWTVAAAAGGLLWRRERAHPAPMLAVDLLRVPVFALSALTSVCSFTTQGLAFVSLPFLLQGVLGYSAVETGLLITPWPAVVAVMALVAGRLSDRWPAGVLGSLGMAGLSLGMASLAALPAHAGVAGICWRMALCGAGFGFFQAPNLKAIMGAAPARRSGGASGIVATCRLLGQSFGAGLVALCFHAVAHPAAPALALWLGSGFALAGAVASVMRLVPRGATRAG